MLSKCCTNILSIGCFTHCACIETGLTAPVAGEYVIEYQGPGESVTTRTVTYGLTDDIKFENFMPEVGVSIFKIKKPDGTYLTDTQDSTTYDCFSVEISPSYPGTVDVCS